MTNEESLNPEERDDLQEEEIPVEETVSSITNALERQLPNITNRKDLETRLAESVPDKFISLLEKQIDNQAEIAKIIEDNRHREEENRHKEALVIEENKRAAQTSSENTKRIIIGSAVAIVFSGFIYSGFTKDSSLPDKIITTLVSMVAGAGGLSLVTKDNKKPPKND